MDAWSNFFLGELGAAAALAGLLFVSLSVNQARILELGRIAERGLDALTMLLLVLLVSSVVLIPQQPPRLIGAEIVVIAVALLWLIVRLQLTYMRGLASENRKKSLRTVVLEHVAVGFVLLGGVTLVWRGDWAGVYLLPPGVLLAFVTAGLNAWVLLIEINR